MFAQEFFSQKNFPYQDVITHWKDEKVHIETTMQKFMFVSWDVDLSI
jgi:hypothetical protein